MHEPITDEQMRAIAELIGRIVNQNQRFKIFPPREVIENPEVLTSDEAPQKLAGTIWRLSLSDGSEERLPFAELMALAYQLAMIQVQVLKQQGQPGQNIEVDLHCRLEDLLAPEHVKLLLGKLSLEGLG